MAYVHAILRDNGEKETNDKHTVFSSSRLISLEQEMSGRFIFASDESMPIEVSTGINLHLANAGSVMTQSVRDRSNVNISNAVGV